ncbi:MAG: right-handed parallel beta-helix repeat-containing protein [Tahibacter sp.]
MRTSTAGKTFFSNFAFAAVALLAGSAVQAADFFVDVFDDGIDDELSDSVCHTIANTCTLRAAIMQANHTFTAGAITVVHVPAGTYVLTRPPFGDDDEQTGDLNLATPYAADQQIIVMGSGIDSTIIDANQIDRGFGIETGRVATIAELTVRNGNHPVSYASGGGIFNSGNLTVSHCLIRDNTANYGGGIYNKGVLNVQNSTIGPNSAYLWGGGLNLDGTTTIRDSTISGNAADYGGGITTYSNALTIVNSTVSDNTATTSGGGIYAFSPGGPFVANVYLYNASIVFNDADHDHDERGGTGGGIFATAGGRFLVDNTLIAANTQLGGYFDDDCSGTLEVYGFNLFGDLTGCAFTGNGNVARGIVSPTTIDAVLRNNGGPTPTHALLAGSQAIDASRSGCDDQLGTPLAADQRGAPRAAGVRCDVGAFEYGSSVPADDTIFKNGFE